MKLKRIVQIIDNSQASVEPILVGRRYYENQTDILSKGVVPAGENKDPLRNADNRIVHNFHEMLVDEKTSYLFTYPPLIDIDGKEEVNKKVTNILGQDYARKLKNLCIEASNGGLAWLHCWIDTNTKDEYKFKYELVNAEQVRPIYSNGLEKKLESVIRHYTQAEYDKVEEKEIDYKYIEYWTDAELVEYKIKASNAITEDNAEILSLKHNLGVVPFIEFDNNIKKQSDLVKYKTLIDLADRVMSGFANDLDDIQEIIYILENYGGEKISEFLQELKKEKAIKVESDGAGGGGDLRTLQIDIPVEARKVVLEYLRKQISEAGQSLPFDFEKIGVASGVALKFLYRKLELKAGLMETEFRDSINKLIEMILNYYKIPFNVINQTWTRNMISNDTELADLISKSRDLVPSKILLRNHPLVDNVEEAEQLLEEEEKESMGDYTFPVQNEDDK